VDSFLGYPLITPRHCQGMLTIQCSDPQTWTIPLGATFRGSCFAFIAADAEKRIENGFLNAMASSLARVEEVPLRDVFACTWSQGTKTLS